VNVFVEFVVAKTHHKVEVVVVRPAVHPAAGPVAIVVLPVAIVALLVVK
jgi:hypothetical protein